MTLIAFTKNGENKAILIELICEVIVNNSNKALNKLKFEKIIFSKENCCLMTDVSGTHNFEILKSNREEASTKVILHCLNAFQKPDTNVVLRSPSPVHK